MPSGMWSRQKLIVSPKTFTSIDARCAPQLRPYGPAPTIAASRIDDTSARAEPGVGDPEPRARERVHAERDVAIDRGEQALGERDCGGGDGGAGHSTVTGVPTGISRASLRMSGFRSRTHPCETWPGTRSGSFVPWMPINPPPGQSVRTAER